MLSFQLKKRLRHFTVELSQEIGAETLVLIGHSGCGKSTMLKMLTGLLSPDEGSIQLDGRTLWDGSQGIQLPPEERNIGYVFQNYALFPHLTVFNNVGYGISSLEQEERTQRILEALDFLGIRHLAQAKPAMLSGGEQQRVALARALVTRPKLLLLDEPLSALDVSTRSHVRTELKELLQKLSIPSIVVTHDYEDARVLADRVAVMDQGVIIQSGNPKEIAQYPASDFVAEFIGTNLLPHVEPGQEQPSFVSVHPWHVEISEEPQPRRYQWSGKIRDMAFQGGFVRLHIEGEVSILADVRVELVESQNYKVNQEVFASVRIEHARVVEGAVVKKRTRTSASVEPTPIPMGGKRTRWKGLITAAAVILAVGITGYGLKTDAVNTTATAAPTKEMFALVAANATHPFNELMETFEEQHPTVKMGATFAGTQILRTQLEQGAKADIFLSADLMHIEAVKEQGLIDEFFPVSKGHEVIVVPKGNPAAIQGLEDLGSKKVKLVIGVDNVPIGAYTREIFDNAKTGYGEDFPQRVLDNVVSFETSTKQVLQKVGLGEAQAGIVYRTDVTPDFQQKVEIVEIPKEYNVQATNYIAVTKVSPSPELAQEFLKFSLSDDGQAIFIHHGYDPLN
ncbi:molybdate ABC transporter substrate-binding protein [Ammoniphilus sp. YIM 78166]|uniref:molybdate ABC transporter substrate-binding protein n=1 Tax=Ammoniphilus sp. YIM 78166 TaxID=1644106 RepID=UPI0014304CE7|nr:molybdate ABC transporter substrate-binding protein [Ammoniphilus sp. YIM 78166]